MSHLTDHAHVHPEQLSAVAITSGGVRVIHLAGVAECPSELWRVEFVPAGPAIGASAAPERLRLGIRSTPPRRRGRVRRARVTFEAIIEDPRTREIEVHLECQPAVVVPVLEAVPGFGAGARASRPDPHRRVAPASSLVRAVADAVTRAIDAVRATVPLVHVASAV
ncbi:MULTISPECIES: hypothetical protein [unclassified Agromyces]|uniref:hypothetical protein n=1 Tax=unclassified Agromyces TaxID=2639701 RepID=UPI0030151EC4